MARLFLSAKVLKSACSGPGQGFEDGTAIVVEHRATASSSAAAVLGTIITGDDGPSLDTVRLLEISVAAPGGATPTRARPLRWAARPLALAAVLGLCVLCGAVGLLLHYPHHHHPAGAQRSPRPATGAADEDADHHEGQRAHCTPAAVSSLADLCHNNGGGGVSTGVGAAAGHVVSPPGCLPRCAERMEQLLSECSLNLSLWGGLHPNLGLPGSNAAACEHTYIFPQQVGQWVLNQSGCDEGDVAGPQHHRALEVAGAAAAAAELVPDMCVQPLHDGFIGLGAGRGRGVALFDAAQVHQLRSFSHLLELELNVPKVSGGRLHPFLCGPHFD
eukprot:COSAG01_NODE_1233_length_11110_cov_13.006902_2_plen_331_part_00